MRQGWNTLVGGDLVNARQMRVPETPVYREPYWEIARKYPGKEFESPVQGHTADVPSRVADVLETLLHTRKKALWTNYDHRLWQQGYRKFEPWLGREGPLAPLNEYYGLNCGEMIGYAAAMAGALNKHQLCDLFEPVRRPDGTRSDENAEAWGHRIADRLIPGERHHYTGKPSDPRPQRGDIVIWNASADHITMATGRTGKDGSPEVYSFWNVPKNPLTWDENTQSYAAVSDAVQETTIDELTKAMYDMRDKDGNPVFESSTKFDVIFGRGPW